MNERATESAFNKTKSEKRVRVVSHRTTVRLEAAALAALKMRRGDSENLEDLAGSGDGDDDDNANVNADDDDNDANNNHEEHREDIVVGGSGEGGT
jgi:hypothetical protein